MKVSIVIPVYNVEEYIRQCIDSVIAQKYSNIEVILVNDGSTDNSRIICEEYEKRHQCVKLINKENGGLSDSRNVGILNSTGEYIMFLDSDDYWEGDFLISLIEFITKNGNPDYIFFNYKYYYQKKNIYKESNINICRDEVKDMSGMSWLNYILKNNKKHQWFACMGIVKRSFILENKLFFEKGRNYEDVLWTPHVFLKAQSVEYFDREVYIYRLERDGQITSNFSYKNLEDNIYLSKYWYKELQELVVDKKLKRWLLENFTTRYYVSIWFSGFLDRFDKKNIITLLKQSSYLLEYTSSPVIKVTKVLCKIFGFDFCSGLFKLLISVKRKLRN